MLVCLGSTLIMLTSIYVFDIYKDIGPVDPSRMAAGVITGIGFIGAGAIIRYGMAVKGLTTAATLWVTSAVGLAIGCGFYLAGFKSGLWKDLKSLRNRTEIEKIFYPEKDNSKKINNFRIWKSAVRSVLNWHNDLNI